MILGDYSRFIVAWRLDPNMGAWDVSDTLAVTLRLTGLDHDRSSSRPRLLSDNSPAISQASCLTTYKGTEWRICGADRIIRKPGVK